MISMTQAQYDAMLRYASAGSTALAETAEFLLLRNAVDDLNAISRYTLSIRWQSVPEGVPPPGTTEYPPMQYRTLEMSRVITRTDVDEVLRGEVTLPELVHVTPDPQLLVGWTLLDTYDF